MMDGEPRSGGDGHSTPWWLRRYIMSCDDMRKCTAGYVYPIITDASDVTLCPLMPIGIHQLLLLSIHTHVAAGCCSC